MRILHVITGLRKAAGTSVFAGEVSNELVARGHEVSIAVSHSQDDDRYPLDSRVKVLDISSVDVSDYDIVHVHALWAPVLSRIAKSARRAGVKVVWSPHGMLTPWALKNKWWKKFAGLALYQWWSLRQSDVLHATAQCEVEDVRRLCLKNKVVVAPLGVRLHHLDSEVGKLDKDAKKTLLFVSRVQRKKGLPNLLEAWARLPKELRCDWHVRIVGPDEDNHIAELRGQAERLGILDEVDFVGPVYGDELSREYASASLFILPTHSENFGSVVIEALAHEVPVICTKGAPWQDLAAYGCGWWIDIGVDPLVEVLKTALALSSSELSSMGQNGRSLVESRYAWPSIATTLETIYKGSVAHGSVSNRD